MTTIEAPAPGRIAQIRASLTPAEWRRAGLMFGSIILLHVIGFGVFIFLVVPQHYRGLGIGVAVIDNTTRKLMNDGQRPLSVGYFFSLGHSTIVVVIGVGIVIAEKAVYGAVSNDNSGLEQFGGVFGTIVSAAFLYLIALLNIVILWGIVKVWRSMRRGEYDEAALEAQLESRGLMYRFFGRWMRSINKPWQMYPVGVVFGMGFDTATEVALLATTALDGCFMNTAYGWAFMRPVRKVYYNLTITGLSVAICYFIGTIEVLGLVPQELHWTGGFWTFMEGFDINKAGFVIVGMFVVTWFLAVTIWKFGKIEQKWETGLAASVEPAE
jgi:high-affinity nickel-transport protein